MKFRNLTIISMALFLTMSSCQDMDLTPKTNTSSEDFWKTSNDYKLAANKFYHYLESFHGSDVLSNYDLKADLATSYADFNSVSNGRWLPQENDAVWSDSYAQLRQINNLIEHADKMQSQDAEIMRYRAEALFFRAYVYYRLVSKFGDVPLILKVLDINSPELTMGRTPRNQVEDQILSDLTEAEDYLPKQTELNKEDGRITQGAVLAFKARAALFFASWGKNHNTRKDFVSLYEVAKQAAEDVMNTNVYELYDQKGEDSYRQLFLEAGDGCKEIILARKYGKDVAPGTTHPNNDNVSAGFMGGATRKFADMFLDKNGYPITHSSSCFKGYKTPQSEFEDRDPRMTSILQVPGRSYIYASTNGVPTVCPAKFTGICTTRTGYRLWKYISDLGGLHQGLCYYDAKLIRYAEVLLIYAEAVYELKGSISDTDLDRTINLIRKRVGMPALTNAFVNENGLNMLEEIRRERTIELSFEANRYDDIRRWKIAEQELPKNMLGVYWNSEYADANDDLKPVLENGFIVVEKDRRFNPNRDYLAPLPTKQVSMSNNALQQNPNW